MGEMQTMGEVGQALAARMRAMVEATGQTWPEASATTSTPGSARQCEACADIGYVRLDVQIDDPQFGKLVPCPYCEKGRALRQRQKAHRATSLQASSFRSVAGSWIRR